MVTVWEHKTVFNEKCRCL